MPKWQKPSAALVEAFNTAIVQVPGAEPWRMFGCPCAFANGQMFAGVHQETLFVRLPENERQELLKLAGAHPFEPMAGRPMREYVVLPAALVASDDDLHNWLVRGLQYAQSLPPKKR